MARSLSKVLIKYQRDEEANILRMAKDLDESSKALVRELYEPLVSTKINECFSVGRNALPILVCRK